MGSNKFFGILLLFTISLVSCQDQTQLIRQDIPLQFEIRTEISDLSAIAFDRTISTLSIENYNIPALTAYSEGDRINNVTIESISFRYRGLENTDLNYSASVSLQVAQNPTSVFSPLASGDFEDVRREIFYGRQNPLTKFAPQEEGPSEAIQLLEQSLKNQSPFLLRISKIYNDTIPPNTRVSIIFKGNINVNAFERIEEEEVSIDAEG